LHQICHVLIPPVIATLPPSSPKPTSIPCIYHHPELISILCKFAVPYPITPNSVC
jgi:hypothetical protein